MKTEYHVSENERVIDELYVFMSIDDQGRHGIVAQILPGLGSTPLVTGSPKAAEALKPIVRQIARETGQRIGLFVFKRQVRLWGADEA